MTKTSWGAKRVCAGCGARFYDLGKNPAGCPKCGVMQDINAQTKTRRGRKAAVVEVAHDEPLVKEKAKAEAKQKIKKPIKEIEGIDLEEFEGIETLDNEEEIEELEEMEDIESLEELEEIEETVSDDEAEGVLEEGGGNDGLIDTIDDEEEEEEEEDDQPKAKRGAVKTPAKKKK